MHRTTTTAALLVSVAAALTGCTTVQGPPAADQPATGARSSAPRPDGPAEPRVVQAPAREALEMIGPSRPPDHATDGPRRTTPPAAPPAHEPPAAPARPGQQPSARPEAPKRTHAPERPRAEVPGLTRSPGTGGGGRADVCSLGKEYGGWRPGSPEVVICDQAYGR
ncbi:hypothetical protein J2S54_005880 [Streptomyces sp. DSM 42143]|uniref:hypothetical protein n=1 Tax=Streptomyces TaxID=1883 RepID=UPI002788EA54|nr:hypothetical protein [Streptomyces sp. DSM 42143]MDQ0389060.1 hypothetical protein [Streptomyces sp. DSM 42143]